ncbi:MAG: HigA family addiction module antitoxin [Chloroflexota bacterium]
MNRNGRPARVISPGKILTQELDARDWTQRDLAVIMGRPYQAINEIINGTKQITPDTARELAYAFGTSIDFWMSLEANYRLHLAEQNVKEQEIQKRSHLYSVAPIREMIKRGWIKGSDNVAVLERQLLSFFRVATLDEAMSKTASLRVSQNRGAEIASQLAWVQRVENLVQEREVGDFSVDRLRKAIPSILDLSYELESIARVPEMLKTLGVHFVVLPHLPKTYLDGVAISTDKNPIIGLTLRYDRIDSFWFTLMHELAHIISGHRGIILDDTEQRIGSADRSEEDEANQAATEWLVDRKTLLEFVEEVKPYFSKPSIEAVARQLHRHPGIVLGQLHHQKVVEYKHLRNLLVRVKPYLAKWEHN